MTKIIKKLTRVAARAVSFIPAIVFAQEPTFYRGGAPPSPGAGYNGPQKPDDIINKINLILYYVSLVFWIAAAGFVFYAAYLYLGAAGNEERVKKAKQQLLYAVIAIVIALMATGLPTLISNTIKP